jgi:hypothetical protein
MTDGVGDQRSGGRTSTAGAKAVPVRPNFLIIGAEKAGTTFLQETIQLHPEVFMPPGEVPFFEDPDYSAPDAASNFSKLFEPAIGKRAIGLKRPNYLHKPECPARIHEYCPAARLIIVLRDPVERAISAYYHSVLNCFAPLRHPNWGIPAILAGRVRARYPRSQEVVDFGFYYRDLQRYLALFPRQQILIIFFEDLCADPAFTQRRVFQFLGVDTARVPPLPSGKVNEGVYAMPRLALLRLKNRLVYRYSNGRTRLWPKGELGQAAQLALACIERMDRQLRRRTARKNTGSVSLEVKRRLADHYIDDTRQLEALLGVNLSHWQTGGH